MPRTQTLLLNAHALAQQLSAQGMEQWWVAERLGVSRRSVNRWLSGAVKRINRDNLQQLARLLGCGEEALLAPGEEEVFATRADQALAMQELLSSEAVFHAAEQNSLYETMLRAVLHPGLSLYQRCVLFTRLMVAAAKQGKFEASRRYAQLALDCARAGNDSAYEHAIHINLGAMEAEAGNLGEARRLFETTLATQATVGKPHHLVSITNNLGNLLRLQGELEAARHCSTEAVRLAESGGRAMQLLNALISLADLELDCRDWAAARIVLLQALALDCRPPQVRRQAEARLSLAVIDAEEGQPAKALAALAVELPLLRSYDYFSQPPQLNAARILRLAGKLDAARKELDEGLLASTTRRYELPLLLLELARVERAAGRLVQLRKTQARARKQLCALGMQARANWPL